ncbi:MAG: hypothetical protein KAU91_06500, partial [Candidatus Aminicenantes bacterium]|nr:hypothetical protein [Candidatus Aminicenantes bacterium]
YKVAETSFSTANLLFVFLFVFFFCAIKNRENEQKNKQKNEKEVCCAKRSFCYFIAQKKK